MPNWVDLITTDEENKTQARPKKRAQQGCPCFSRSVLAYLEAWFFSPDHVGDQSPTKPEKIRLLEQTGLNETQLNGWFKRERLKQKQLAAVPSPLFPPITHLFPPIQTSSILAFQGWIKT